MSSEGQIIKIAGPLVVAQGIPRARMFDVVRVGKERLIGEILEIRGDNASIQVYEETGGLKPGEPVESTYQPLSVELAPGILGNIYDGIQRPLDLIMAMKGDFISRGIELPAIDREKEWDFKPTVKEGEKVTAGDVLGVVQETEIVEHRILVPFGIAGKIKKIREGKVKVEDTIAVIRTPDGKEKEISMLQRWPVRKMRPYKKQLNPEEPLITGQRVIDTFFPIAKGGTACIPGPFGSGKCVSGKTPVILGDGTLLTMEELYRKCLKEGKAKTNGLETIIEINPSLSLFSMNTNKVEGSNSSIFYKGKTDSIIRIKTRSGRLVEVTPSHKLFRINEAGEIVQTKAENLQVGDFIVAVRKIETKNKKAKFDLHELKEARVVDTSVRERLSQILRNLRKKRQLSRVGISKVNAESFIYKRNLPPLSLVKKVYSQANLPLPIPKQLRGARWGQNIHIPPQASPELGEVVGLFIAEGHIRTKNTAVFTNGDDELLKRFTQLINSAFGIKTIKEIQKGKTPGILIHNKIFVDFIKAIDAGGSSSEKQIPTLILRSSDKILSTFLKGYYLGDGSFSQGEIELSTASEKLQIGLSYALTRLGILHLLAIRKFKEKNYYRIFVRGINNLKIFYELMNKDGEKFDKIRKIKDYINSKKTTYTSYDLVPLSSKIISKLYRSSKVTYSQLKARGVEISNYIGNRERMSTSTFKRFTQLLKEEGGKEKYSQIFRLSSLLDYVFCDRVVSIEKIKGSLNVYDVCIPQKENFVGGYGPLLLHNTVVQHQLSKWVDAEIIVFVGCGERGNEMTDVLREFPKLKDPKTGKPLMERTVLIANTSNMPVAAREASIYTGITLAEYYRDMGYNVALMADSTSRWAEALREMSGRLEEMPGEEGYPAYLPSRLAEFYERAGRIICLGRDERKASLSAIGAVSPPGGDLSEPVTQATLRVVRVFWALVAELAYQRHFPAIHWLRSYSLYLDELKGYFAREVATDWMDLRTRAMALLQKEDELRETVRLVGLDALSNQDRIAMETARSLREDLLQQFAFHPIDTYTSIKKQYLMLKMVLNYYDECITALKKGVALKDLTSLPVREDIAKAKYIPDKEVEKEMEKINQKLRAEVNDLITKTGSAV
ncbi:MAG: V-type ATP synthase subunit A [bacterium]